MQFGPISFPVRINRLTGYTEVFFGGNWLPQSEGKRGSVLPGDQQSKITGTGGIHYGKFHADIYNGSNWIVNEVLVRIVARDKGGGIKWDRKYKISTLLPPLSTGEINTKVTGGEAIASFEWSIEQMRGYRPN